MADKVFKICTVGCGAMSSRGHGPSHMKYANLDENKGMVKLAACCDLNPEAASKYREKFGYEKHYADMDLMLDNEKPDVVCLIVPEPVTEKLACRIIKKGYPVIMEKPPGLSTLEALSILNAAKESGVANRVAFNRRYMPLVRKLKEEVEKIGAPEKIQNIRYDFYRYNRCESDFYTTAIHGIDTVRHLAGCDYKHIRFHYQELKGEGDNVINIFMDCEMESGATAQLNFCPMSGAIIERATIHLKDNLFMLHLPVWDAYDAPGSLLHFEKGKLKSELTGVEISDGGDFIGTNGFYFENAEFFDCLRSGEKAAGSIETAVQTSEVTECVKHKAAEYIKK